MIPSSEPIPAAALDLEVTGQNLGPGRFRDQLGPEGTLLVFLRHLGCIFCREQVAELRALRAGDSAWPSTLLVYPATADQGGSVLAQLDPEARAIADPTGQLSEAFGLARGGLWQLFQPASLARGFQAVRQGHSGGWPAGDVFRMPGAFLIEGGRIVRAHRAEHAGDSPAWPEFVAIPA